MAIREWFKPRSFRASAAVAELQRNRPPTDEELALIQFLLAASEDSSPIQGLSEARVDEMADGGMGSLQFVSTKAVRYFGGSIGDCQVTDADGICVCASLIVDQDGDLYELNMFKGGLQRLGPYPAHRPDVARG